MTLKGYSDADFASCWYMYKTTSGYIYILAGGVISHQVKRQSVTTLSSTESEYYRIAKAAIEAAWLYQLF